ncbi:MAG UNVERIFIED_CONTAM: hypothetical protein LVR29_20235 [Microcystis novacekii LVE1205-3]
MQVISSPILDAAIIPPFWSCGYSAIMVTDTANMRNPYYHSSQDTIATLDLNFLNKSLSRSLFWIAIFTDEIKVSV